MASICLIVCISWLTGCLLRLYRGTAERDNNSVILCNNYDIVTTFGANTRTCSYLCHVDYYDLVWLFVVQVHDSLFQQVSLELSYLIDLLILAVLAGLLRHLRQLIYSRIYWCKWDDTWYALSFLSSCFFHHVSTIHFCLELSLPTFSPLSGPFLAYVADCGQLSLLSTLRVLNMQWEVFKQLFDMTIRTKF